ncbi:Acyl-CoA N-acyltransferases (NAT) superfamily protein [Euphorbia peplus]|nr:Acyl-CoA N-acyltransferases (NAT) superfamily protein [Euphorbia peplus]
MAAVATSLTLCLNLHSDPLSHQRLPTLFSSSSYPHKSHPFSIKSFSSSHTSPSSSAVYSNLEESFKTRKFLTNEELQKLNTLQNFKYYHQLDNGSLCIRVMRSQEIDVTVKLLAESFAESMFLPGGYVALLRFLVKQYLMERRSMMPYAVTLVGFYVRNDENGEEDEEEREGELAGTVEVCFDKRGANASPPTPVPPMNSPYICNMTVKDSLRRKGIGWNLLKASEELISQMACIREVYLHCRMIDSAPFNMYTKAGYSVVKTDSILVLLLLQRRKHLMSKKLPVLKSCSELDFLGADMEISSQLDT